MQNKKEKLEDYIIKNIDKMYRLAYSYAKNQQYAEDILDESVVRAIASIDSLKNIDYLGTWFYRIIINTANTYLKKQSKIIYIDEAIENTSSYNDKYDDTDLYNAVMNLKEQYRIIIILRFYEDMTLEKISMILNENINTVKTRLYKALKLLRQNIGKDVNFNEGIF